MVRADSYYKQPNAAIYGRFRQSRSLEKTSVSTEFEMPIGRAYQSLQPRAVLDTGGIQLKYSE